MRKQMIKRYLFTVALCSAMALFRMPADVSAKPQAILPDAESLKEMHLAEPDSEQIPVSDIAGEESLSAEAVKSLPGVGISVPIEASTRGYYEALDFQCDADGYYRFYSSETGMSVAVYRLDGEETVYTGAWSGNGVFMKRGNTYRIFYSRSDDLTPDVTVTIRFTGALNPVQITDINDDSTLISLQKDVAVEIVLTKPGIWEICCRDAYVYDDTAVELETEKYEGENDFTSIVQVWKGPGREKRLYAIGNSDSALVNIRMIVQADSCEIKNDVCIGDFSNGHAAYVFTPLETGIHWLETEPDPELDVEVEDGRGDITLFDGISGTEINVNYVRNMGYLPVYLFTNRYYRIMNMDGLTNTSSCQIRIKKPAYKKEISQGTISMELEKDSLYLYTAQQDETVMFLDYDDAPLYMPVDPEEPENWEDLDETECVLKAGQQVQILSPGGGRIVILKQDTLPSVSVTPGQKTAASEGGGLYYTIDGGELENGAVYYFTAENLDGEDLHYYDGEDWTCVETEVDGSVTYSFMGDNTKHYTFAVLMEDPDDVGEGIRATLTKAQSFPVMTDSVSFIRYHADNTGYYYGELWDDDEWSAAGLFDGIFDQEGKELQTEVYDGDFVYLTEGQDYYIRVYELESESDVRLCPYTLPELQNETMHDGMVSFDIPLGTLSESTKFLFTAPQTGLLSWKATGLEGKEFHIYECSSEDMTYRDVGFHEYPVVKAGTMYLISVNEGINDDFQSAPVDVTVSFSIDMGTYATYMPVWEMCDKVEETYDDPRADDLASEWLTVEVSADCWKSEYTVYKPRVLAAYQAFEALSDEEKRLFRSDKSAYGYWEVLRYANKAITGYDLEEEEAAQKAAEKARKAAEEEAARKAAEEEARRAAEEEARKKAEEEAGKNNSGSGQSAAQNETKPKSAKPKIGSKWIIGFAKYKVVADGEVALEKLISRNNKSYKVPDSINISGYEMKVVTINSKAFKGAKKMKNLTIGRNVRTIGKKAFFGCGNLKKVNIYGKSLKTVGSKAFGKIKKKAQFTIFVSKKKTFNLLKRKLKTAGAKSVNAGFRYKKSK